MEDLQNDLAKGVENFPEDLVGAYDLLLNYQDNKAATVKRGNISDHITFKNVEKKDKSHIVCWKCGKKGQYHDEPNCPVNLKEREDKEKVKRSGDQSVIEGNTNLTIGDGSKNYEEYDDFSFLMMAIHEANEDGNMLLSAMETERDHAVRDETWGDHVTVKIPMKRVNPH
uniref:CCHC-type domain-containing protein n=1 Tax=Odontella aurita TaxID=265563 RepID=A0A7S4MMQ2_9STRA|mmetsp:Transcript_26397/g.78064  ORF Transcript_26397/g.78064 Transcript_26397/m.78064 type:complete len:170 (+) Transcript_26397:998-1507(+)